MAAVEVAEPAAAPLSAEASAAALLSPADRQQKLQELGRQVRALERQEAALHARTKLLQFVEFTMPDPEQPDDPKATTYAAAKHHRAIARALEEVEAGGIQQLILTVPPRHGKTELATKRFVAWCSGRHPDWNIAVAAYSDVMAEDYGADVRSILQGSPFGVVFPQFGLQRGGTAKDRIQTTRGGLLVFVGRGGALTGRGAHLLVIDDIFKDAEEARSQAIRDQAWSWFTRVAMTRRMGPKLVLIIMTRWHEDDIVGRLIDRSNPHFDEGLSERWKIIDLPAIAQRDDPLGRAPGEALWPERFDLRFLDEQRRLDPLGFEALYQQRPTVADGVLFRRENIRYYRPQELPPDLTIYAASDHAVGTDRAKHDASCFLTVGVDHDSNIYLLDCIWDRLASNVAVEAMLDMAAFRQPVVWWAEKGQISKSIGPFLRKRMDERRLWFNLREVTPATNKEQRAQSIAGRVAMGKVYFPREAPWTERAIDEMLKFPLGRNDDFVDALAYIGLGLLDQYVPAVPRSSEQEPKYGTLAWVKWISKHQRRQAQTGLGGF